MFDLATFIQQSNLIDPQPDIRGRIIPGAKPGDLLFDNQKNAWDLVMEYAKVEEIPPSVARDIHRKLTTGVDFFEHRQMSGEYRKCGVRIGHEVCPDPSVVPVMMDKIWYPEIQQQAVVEPMPMEIEYAHARMFYDGLAWHTHNLFETIHPFIDGNGRTGRLILNMMRVRFGLEPIVIEFENRFEYYKKIQNFRARGFEKYIHKLEEVLNPNTEEDKNELA